MSPQKSLERPKITVRFVFGFTSDIIEAMKSSTGSIDTFKPQINYIGFISRRTTQYAINNATAKPGIPSAILSSEKEIYPNLELCRCFFWFDKVRFFLVYNIDEEKLLTFCVLIRCCCFFFFVSFLEPHCTN
jgi:hypothetical protein